MGNADRRRKSKPEADVRETVVPAQKGLRAKQLEIDGEQYAVLVFPLPAPTTLRDELTAAEADVVALVLRGFSNDEIGAKRGSSPRTVANQLQAIYRKLGIGSRVELAHVMATGALLDK